MREESLLWKEYESHVEPWMVRGRFSLEGVWVESKTTCDARSVALCHVNANLLYERLGRSLLVNSVDSCVNV